MTRSRANLLLIHTTTSLTLLLTAVGCRPAPSLDSSRPPESTASPDRTATLTCSPETISPAESLVAQQPTDPEAQARLGEAYRSCFEHTQDSEDARKAADAYTRAALLALQQGDVRYTREVSEVLVQLQDKARLQEVFGKILAKSSSGLPDRHYIALLDYADALASLHDEAAWGYFERAIELSPQDNIEAVNRNARQLIDHGQPQKAIELLETRLTPEQRIRFRLPAYLRREALQRAGLDTAPADAEIARIENRRGSPRSPR